MSKISENPTHKLIEERLALDLSKYLLKIHNAQKDLDLDEKKRDLFERNCAELDELIICDFRTNLKISPNKIRPPEKELIIERKDMIIKYLLTYANDLLAEEKTLNDCLDLCSKASIL